MTLDSVKAIPFGCLRAVAAPLMRTRLRRSQLLVKLYFLLNRGFGPKGIRQVQAPGGRMNVRGQDQGVGALLLIGDVYEAGETQVLSRLLEPGMVMLDVGANIGYYTLLASKLVGPTGRVVSFEPVPENFELLSQNVQLNERRNVTLVNQALLDRPGELTLYKDGRNLGCHSLWQGNVLTEDGQIRVPATSLDTFLEAQGIERVDVVKMDVQGAEALVLSGGERLLSQDGLKLIIEFWPKGLRNAGTEPAELLAFLKGKGLRISLFGDDGRIVPAGPDAEVVKMAEDLLCINLLCEK